MSQTDPTHRLDGQDSFTDRLPEFPTAGQLGFLGAFITLFGFVAVVLAYNDITLFAPVKQAAGFSAAGLSLLVAATLIKAREVVGNVAD